ncbi:unnamed protein product [Ambrosiozyma monospora]|uniref:Unnamed protein product n=1 Tax=Ambrosiozyma monospora TaxID=43982 RepID=A0ACB5TC36_AMBMO|nr:unnamed protein product [Ambrosiozyma monospora]
MRLSVLIPILTSLLQLGTAKNVYHPSKRDSNNVGYVKMTGSKAYGDSYSAAVNNANSNSKAVTSIQRKEASDGSVTFSMKNQGVFYSVDVGIGANGDTVTILLDTGSSDFWVMNKNNTYCSASSSSGKAVGSSTFLSNDVIDNFKRDDYLDTFYTDASYLKRELTPDEDGEKKPPL